MMSSKMLRPFMRPSLRPTSLLQNAQYTTPTKSRRVQTPIQSVPKEKVAPAPLEPETGSTPQQTPIQSQIPRDVDPTLPQDVHHGPQRGGDIKGRPLVYMASMTALSCVFIYYYYYYRKEHMEAKWAAMQAEAKERVANRKNQG